MIIKVAIIIFAITGLIVAIVPFLHSVNRDRIFKANFYEEDFNYAMANKIKRKLDVLFISNIIIASLSLSYCMAYIFTKF